MAKHLQLEKNSKRLNIKILFSFLSIAFLFFILFNFKNLNAYFNNIIEKINNISLNTNYTIKFDANSGTGSMSEQKISYNVLTKLNKNEFTKEGYVFKGWNTQKEVPSFIKGNDINTEEGNGLPSEYQEVEYIESTGTQYIETPYQFRENDVIEIGITPLEENVDKAVFGAYEAEEDMCELGYYLNVLRGNVADISGHPSIVYNIGEKYDLKNIAGQWQYNDVAFGRLANKNVYINSLLFARKYNNKADKKSCSRIWYFRVFRNDELIYNFVPCYRKIDNEMGMYDTVNNVFYSNNFEITFTDEEEVINLGNKMLYAQWKEEIYSISYNLNGGTLENENVNAYTINTEDFILNNPEKEGYTFKGWSGTNLVGDKNTTVTILKGSTGDREYLANYTPNTYYIKFNANGASGSVSKQTLTYDLQESIRENIFTRVGYKFLGWNTLEDGTGISYTDEEEVINLTTINGEIINLYAQWELLPTRYAVQIYGINQDVDEEDNILGLTFGPATSANYNCAYVTHRYVENDEGTYNIEIVTTTVDAYGSEDIQTIETLLKSNDEPVTRTEEQVAQRQNINLHEMSWEEIAAVEDKTLFEDCMLCGDTKKVEIVWSEQIKTGNGYNQYGDGAGSISSAVKLYYRKWNPIPDENAYVGSEESGVELEEYEISYGSNAKQAGGYSSSHIRATLIGENEKTNRGYAGDENLTTDTCVFNSIQEDLKNLIVPKKVKYITGINISEGNYTINNDIVDPIWLFSEREFKGTGENHGNELEGIGVEGKAYDKFENEESKFYMETYNDLKTDLKVAYYEYQKDYAGGIWLRSPNLSNVFSIAYIDGTGYNHDIGLAHDTGAGIRFWFLPFTRFERLYYFI